MTEGKSIVVLCFNDKKNMQAYYATHCVGPFATYEAVYRWLDKNEQNHFVFLEMGEPK